MEDPGGVAKHAVRDELRLIERAGRAEGATREDVAERARDRPHLAAVLVLGLGGGLLDRDRRRLVDGAPAHLLHEVREAEVVAEPRVVLDVRVPRHRVDRAVPGGDRARGRLLLAHPHLVAPVDPFHVRAVGALEPQLPADVADLGVGQVPGECAQGIGPPLAVRVGEREDLARGLADRAMLRSDLPLARALQELDAGILRCDLADERIGEVGRAVRRDDDLELLLRVVERERVLDAPADHRLLVVGRDDERDRRRSVGLADRPGPDAREDAHRERIAGVRPGEGTERAPERRPRDHAASISRTSARYRSIATTRSASFTTYSRPRRPIVSSG